MESAKVVKGIAFVLLLLEAAAVAVVVNVAAATAAGTGTETATFPKELYAIARSCDDKGIAAGGIPEAAP